VNAAKRPVGVNVSTATLGAMAGAGGLGTPIISGLVNQDPAVTLQGAIMAALLALGLDALIAAFGTAWETGPGAQTQTG